MSHCAGPATEAGIAGLESRGEDGAELGFTRMYMVAIGFSLSDGIRPRPCLPLFVVPAGGFLLCFRFLLEDDRFWSLEGTGMALAPP